MDEGEKYRGNGKSGGDFDKQTSRLASAPAVATDGSFLPQLLLLPFGFSFHKKNVGLFSVGLQQGSIVHK
jgi:hypothetical protein